MLAAERMSRALKRVAPSRLDEGQETFPLLYGSETVPASDTPATESAAAAMASPGTLHDAEGGLFRDARAELTRCLVLG